MADIQSTNWSETDASNNQASPAGFPESMAPSGVNDSARALMGAVRRWRDRIGPTVTSGGTVNAQTLTYPVAQAALVVGDEFVFTAGLTNTGPMTLAVDGLAATAVVTADGGACVGNEVQTGKIVRVNYNGTFFVLEGIGAQNLSLTNGMLYLPGSSVILKFGYVTITAANTATVNFASGFPNATFGAFLGPVGSAGSVFDAFIGALSSTALTINLSSVQTTTVYWLAIGY